MNKIKFQKELCALLNDDKRFKTALDLIYKISRGKVWLMGSAVYKNLIKIKHGINLPLDDYDFIIQEIKKPLPRLRGWKVIENTFGNFRFLKNGLIVDPVPINNMLLLKKWGWKSTIRNFMRQVGFSVQSIVFDVKNKKLIGQKAIKDINRKVIRINNFRNYRWALEKYGKKVSLKAMAKKLKLKPIN